MRNNTRQRILEVSLELFSQKGFSAVSIRDICGRVQIKESTLYYYFRNKQAVFDELVSLFEEKAEEMMKRLEEGLNGGIFPSNGNFYRNVCDAFFENYLMDDFCNKVMRLLQIEQYGNEKVREIYDCWMFEKPLTFQGKVFRMLMEAGVIAKSDSAYLAVKYYAPISMFARRWLFAGELTEEKKGMFRREAYYHIERFFAEIKAGE